MEADPRTWKENHIVGKAGKEEDSMEEQVKMLRMEKLHQLTDHWNQWYKEENR